MRRMTKAESRRLAADAAASKAWHDRAKEAKARCDAITDLAELAEAARGYLLAQADVQEYVYGRRNADFLAMWRRRANSNEYRSTLAIFWIAERFKKAADAETDITPVERQARTKRDEAETRALLAGINAMIKGALHAS